jgi:peptidoglycan L-alanyl-D-glutamate endopeptidase CwlK
MAKTYRDVSELRPGAREACEAFLKECQAAGLDVFLTETYRSQERQDELYAQGRTKPGKVVTWTKRSKHTERCAWDVSFKSTGYDELGKFYDAGRIADALGIEWGGNWKTPDRPHFQYEKGVFIMPTALKEADELAQKALEKGIITDKALWVEYMTGKKQLTPGNLRALFTKVLNR